MPPTLVTLANFNGLNGSLPSDGLVADALGNLFGTTAFGGPSYTGTYGSEGDGTVFEIPRTATGYGALTPLAAFDRDNGAQPNGTLVADGAGNLFGTTFGGGASGYGTVFELPFDGTSYGPLATLASFDLTTGAAPSGPLLIDGAGDLIGATHNSGTIFVIPKTTSGYGPVDVVATLDDTTGTVPAGGLVADAAGDLFGAAAAGGTDNRGTVFELPKTDTGYGAVVTLVNFAGPNGSGPSGLTMDAAGDLFGTTQSGGVNDLGTVFEIPKTVDGFGPLATLPPFTDGSDPQAPVIVDSAGNLFGTTAAGGEYNDGTVFEIPITAEGYGPVETLVTFDGPNGVYPAEGGLSVRADGTLFGTTYDGGTESYGTVFEITDSGYVACYCAGTLIGTPTGEVPVEALAIGDRVVTGTGAHRPIKWIGRRRYAGRFANGNRDILPVGFKAGALAADTPRRDLWVSPRHAMMIDGLLIPAEHLVNDVSVVQARAVDSVDYFHIELASHDVIVAEGALSETFVDDRSRAMFHNARSFAALYPDAAPTVALYCAPRVEDGFALAAIRSRLAERAGLTGEGPLDPGPLRGTIDRADAWHVEGWAWDGDNPDGVTCLDLLVDGVLRARTLAHRFRDDLAAAGIGSGAHAFRFAWSAPLSLDADHLVEVRRSSDGAALWCSPRRVAARPAA